MSCPARAAYLRDAPEHELAGAPETDLYEQTRRPDARAVIQPSLTYPIVTAVRAGPLVSGGRLEFHYQLSRHPAAVLYLDALRLGPLADLGGIQPARRSPS